jgi:glutathione synthase/RimK-type ligase-like ATP-grasp enzyme
MKSEPDRIFARGDVEDADVIYGADLDKKKRSDQTRIAEKADERDINIKALGFDELKKNFDEIAEKIEGKDFFYRHKAMGYENEEDKIEALELFEELENEYDVNLINDPEAAMIHDRKTDGNNLIEINLRQEGVENARLTDHFTNEEEIEEALEEGKIVKKPEDSSYGNGVEVCEELEDIEEYLEGGEVVEDIRIEEFIDHESEEKEDGRAYIVDGEVEAAAVRENNDSDKIQTNLNKGGEYVEEKTEDLEENEKKALEAAAEGLDFAAVDYVKDNDTGEVVIYEINSTPGTKYEEEFGGLIDPVIDMLEEDPDRESKGSSVVNNYETDNPKTAVDDYSSSKGAVTI